MIGTVLKHRYEVLEKITEGSLFTVYKAVDKIDNRPVAVKVLQPQYASNRMFAERILVEAQAMVGLAHPGIVEVYDCGEEGGTYYVVIEYIRGVDLKERIRRSAPFSLTTAVDVGIAICDVLDFAHRHGFIHGDLRPGNILVTPEGQIKISDFWVTNAIASSQTIRTNAMMRSIHYMSPEVAEGQAPTPMSDMYSLGIILFELLTGNLPFDGDTPIAIALRHARDPVPSIRSINPGVPKSLESVLAKALQKSPESRFRSMKAMLKEMQSVHDGLHLAKPITWSAPVEKTMPVQSAPDPDEPRTELKEAEPTLLSAFRKTLIAIVVIIALAAAALMVWVVTGPGEVKIPNFVGKSLEEAQSIAVDKKLELSVRSEQLNENYPAGTVYFMNPAPNRIVKSGRTVDVWVSKGSKFAKTPAVVGLAADEARSKITSAGLNVGEVSQEYSSKVPAGNIIKQTPAPETRQERSQPVNLVMSLGSEPDETGMQPDEDKTSSEETRTFDVKFNVPKGKEDQEVQIVVQDDNGENITYSDIAHPGDRIEKSVEGTGNKVTIRIYIDDKLVKEERKWR